MATGTLLASTVVMGLVAAVVFYLAANSRAWERYYPNVRGPASVTGQWLRDGRLHIALFVLLSLGAIGGIMLVLEGGASSTLFIFGGAAVLIVAFLVLGTYSAARSRGHPHSHAVGEAIGILGGVLILAVVGNLLTQFGA